MEIAFSSPRLRPQKSSHLKLRTRPRSKRAAKTPAAPPPATPDRILQLAWGFAPPIILGAAVRCGVFDCLDKSALTIGELAVRTKASARGLKAILNALVSLDFLTREGERYALTPESAAFLVSSKPAYYGEFFTHATRQMIPTWMGLDQVVRTGRPVNQVNQAATGPEFFAAFVESLFPLSYRAAQVLGEHLGVPGATSPLSVLDIGAGSGVWGIALAQQSPQVTVHAVDWPRVLEVTRRMAKRHGLARRFHTSPGDLLEADFGAGHRVATVGHILHSEGPERSRALLRRIFGALAPGGTVAISEFVPNEDRTGPANALIFAVNMLVHTETGDTFTFSEIAGWLREAGFKNPRTLEAPAPSPLILAERPR